MQPLAACRVRRCTCTGTGRRCHSSSLKTNSNVSLTVADVGGVVPLTRLLRDGSPAGQQQAACALAEVGLVPANRDIIAEAGGIQALVSLLTSTVVGTPETAARALANLARDELYTPDDGGAPPDPVDGETEQMSRQSISPASLRSEAPPNPQGRGVKP